MKRFGLFLFDSFYPAGGWNDFVGSYDSLADAVALWRERDSHYGNVHIVDFHTGKVFEAGWFEEDKHPEDVSTRELSLQGAA
jgi:hypothetical protein